MKMIVATQSLSVLTQAGQVTLAGLRTLWRLAAEVDQMAATRSIANAGDAVKKNATSREIVLLLSAPEVWNKESA